MYNLGPLNQIHISQVSPRFYFGDTDTLIARLLLNVKWDSNKNKTMLNALIIV